MVVLGRLFEVCKIGPIRLNPILAIKVKFRKIPSLTSFKLIKVPQKGGLWAVGFKQSGAVSTTIN